MTRATLIFLITVLLVSPVRAQTNDIDGVRIFSDSLRIIDQTGVVQFEGNVRVQLKGATITCDRLTVRTSQNDLSQVVSGTAIGGVLMERNGERIQAGEAHFDLDMETVDLTGSPLLTRGLTSIQAERIVYSLDEGTAQFHGPVKAVFLTEGE